MIHALILQYLNISFDVGQVCIRAAKSKLWDDFGRRLKTYSARTCSTCFSVSQRATQQDAVRILFGAAVCFLESEIYITFSESGKNFKGGKLAEMRDRRCPSRWKEDRRAIACNRFSRASSAALIRAHRSSSCRSGSLFFLHPCLGRPRRPTKAGHKNCCSSYDSQYCSCSPTGSAPVTCIPVSRKVRRPAQCCAQATILASVPDDSTVGGLSNADLHPIPKSATLMTRAYSITWVNYGPKCKRTSFSNRDPND